MAWQFTNNVFTSADKLSLHQRIETKIRRLLYQLICQKRMPFSTFIAFRTSYTNKIKEFQSDDGDADWVTTWKKIRDNN